MTTTTAGIIVAGGRSTRMGTSKAHLEWHGSTLLRRVAGILARSVEGPIVVVRAPGQPLPGVPPNTLVVDDEHGGRGPLQGIATGIAAIADRADAAFVSSVDCPFLSPDFVRHVVGELRDGIDIVVPHADGHRHPLASCYRTSVLATAVALLDAGLGTATLLFDRHPTLVVGEDALRVVDPALASIRNVNDQTEYRGARAEPAPSVRVERRGPGPDEQPVGTNVRAATLGAAAAQVGIKLRGRVTAAVNGAPTPADPEWPLVAGDVVSFVAADAGGETFRATT